ncbi:hypothetical protein, partial [Sphingomonas sp. GC_Shp_5]|uniref:hypothetical protein n=1 Tax=Sphingomonas sp. GC_Shp_5 TaxID=2937379 RepID=UPI003211C13F
PRDPIRQGKPIGSVSMSAHAHHRSIARPAAATLAPLIVIALAALAIRTPLAAAHALAALLLILWIVPDTLMLARLARTRRPPPQAIVGVLAGACVIVALGAPAPLRAAMTGAPALVAAMLAIVLAHLGWAAVRARRMLGDSAAAPDRWIAAAGQFAPPLLVRLAAAELRVIHLALFRWGGSADIPADSRGFAYHRHLAPICTALLILSGIETGVYHLLVGHWSRTAALVLFAISDLGFVYLVGLIKSFRLRPILITPDGVRVRGGLLIDQRIDLASITAVATEIVGDEVRAPATLNAALLAWPNVLLRLDPPLLCRTGRRQRRYTAVAFRLDDPAPFVRLLRWRLGQPAA